MSAPLVTDLALARRLERTESASNAAFVEARAAADPAVGATWREVAGAWAMFDGAESPITQTFGLGLFAPAAAGDLATIEAFFAERGAATHHELSPLADSALLALLPERGYRPIEQSTVLWQPLEAERPAPRAGAPSVRQVRADEVPAWADTSARGWGDSPELVEFVRGFGLLTGRSRGTTCFVAEQEGAMVATGAMAIHGGVALLAGASTVPAARGRGAQGALLAARLAFARAAGCDLAMMAAAPGSTSQTNAERQGFRIAYTRTKWRREVG